MAQRKPITKTIRFEVFKRDKFTCQYCGETAPKVVLHVDHIEPVAGGGSNDILNLITACEGCNLGKGARRLDDSSEVQKQHAQLAELQARREQIEMMLQWREAVQAEKQDIVGIVVKAIEKHHPDFVVFDSGKDSIRKWLKRFPLDLILEAVDESFESYFSATESEYTIDKSWHKAFSKVPAVANILRQSRDRPYIKNLVYIQAIARRRCRNKWLLCVDKLEQAHLLGASVDSLSDYTKKCGDEDSFFAGLDRFISEHGGQS